MDSAIQSERLVVNSDTWVLFMISVFPAPSPTILAFLFGTQPPPAQCSLGRFCQKVKPIRMRDGCVYD